MALLQIINDIAKAKADVAAAEQRQQELQQQVAQAKQGKEDSVSLQAAGSCCLREGSRLTGLEG